MSALPSKADTCSALADVRFGPKADIHKARQIAVTQRREGARCRISTRVWPFGKCLWLRILCLRNGIGTPKFLGSPEISVRLRHQSTFFRLIECRPRAGIYLPTPFPKFENIFHTGFLTGQAAMNFAAHQFASYGKPRTPARYVRYATQTLR